MCLVGRGGNGAVVVVVGGGGGADGGAVASRAVDDHAVGIGALGLAF